MIAAERVAAILLAAGRSERFGARDKLVADLDGKPLALHAAEMLGGFAFAARIAAVGDGNMAVAALLAHEGFAIAHPPAGSGMGASIAAAVAIAAAMDVDAVLIALADMPRVPAAQPRALLDHYDPRIGAIGSSDGERPLPPALIGRAHFDAATRLAGDAGARVLLAEAPLIALRPELSIDIDRPEDLGRA